MTNRRSRTLSHTRDAWFSVTSYIFLFIFFSFDPSLTSEKLSHTSHHGTHVYSHANMAHDRTDGPVCPAWRACPSARSFISCSCSSSRSLARLRPSRETLTNGPCGWCCNSPLCVRQLWLHCWQWFALIRNLRLARAMSEASETGTLSSTIHPDMTAVDGQRTHCSAWSCFISRLAWWA